MRIGKQFVVSPLVDEYLNNRQSEILWRLLANPADNGHIYSHNLKQLADDFPQSGLLQALYARSSGENIARASASFDPKALYVVMNAYENLAEVSQSQIIQHGFTVQSENLNGGLTVANVSIEETAQAQVVIAEDEQGEVHAIDHHFGTGPSPAADTVEEAVFESHEFEAEVPAEDQLAEPNRPAYEEEIIEFHETANEEPPAVVAEGHPFAEAPAEDHRADNQLSVYEEEIIESPVSETERISQSVAEGINEPEHAAAIEPSIELPEEDHRANTPQPVFEEDLIESPEATEEEHPTIEQQIPLAVDVSHDIEDDVFDEIAGIESFSIPVKKTITPVPIIAVSPEELEAREINEEAGIEETPVAELPIELHAELEELIPESLAVSDYFVFERAEKIEPVVEVPEEDNRAEIFTRVFEEDAHAAPSVEHAGYETTARLPMPEPEAQRVTRYHDEKMPYTFMWWLDKTRQEHSGIYQPFKLDTTQAIRHAADDTLQQQYYENIFHVKTVDELEKGAEESAIDFEVKNKEDEIIRKFIEVDPHISPPSGDKLGNENKARKSSEDHEELVSETLAKIYTDQMLYHKAINTYKKLILKFPEKSRYFADQIQLLERKIN